MRTLKVFLLVALLCSASPRVAAGSPAAGAPPDTYAYYGDLTIKSPEFQKTFEDLWDLSICDLEVFYTLNLSQSVVPGDGSTPYIGVGVRDRSGLRGAMMSSAPFGNQSAPDRLNVNDKHNLVRPGSVDERDYDATGPDTIGAPIGSYDHVGIWFDRDDIGVYTKLPWGFANKGNFNTAGNYDVAITFHAVNGSRTQGTMFATVNGVASGFWPAGYQSGPAPHYPAGMAFSGTLTDLKIDVGLTSALPDYGQVKLTGISAVGCLAVRYYAWLPMLARP